MQVNTSAEESKPGLPPAELDGFLHELPRFRDPQGAGSDDAGAVHRRYRPGAHMLRHTAHARIGHARVPPELIGPGELSMGMSGDYELAIEEGATCVRGGQAISAYRNTPDSRYWPPAGPTD